MVKWRDCSTHHYPEIPHRTSPLTSITKHAHSHLARKGITQDKNFFCVRLKKEKTPSLRFRRWENQSLQGARSPTRCVHGRLPNFGEFNQAKISSGGRFFFMVPGYLDSVYTWLYSIMGQCLYCLHSTHFSTKSISLTSVSSAEAFHQFMTCLMSKSHVMNCPQFCFGLFFKEKFQPWKHIPVCLFAICQEFRDWKSHLLFLSLSPSYICHCFPLSQTSSFLMMLLPKQNDVKWCFVLAKLKFQDDICFWVHCIYCFVTDASLALINWHRTYTEELNSRAVKTAQKQTWQVLTMLTQQDLVQINWNNK